MNPTEIEKKWQTKWAQDPSMRFDRNRPQDKYYVMSMLPYPSGSNLHLGHWYNYAPTDTFARWKKMQGLNVFQPMGFDAFGLPAENFAIKTGVHPSDSTYKNIETMRRQLNDMGAMFDWDATLVTSDPSYYKWTQWLFLQLYKKGLAYRKEAAVNWCSSCNTVIANEQVLDGACERCGTQIVRKNMKQWFFRITDYAEELLSGLDKLDWPEKTKAMQRNWIGKSTGAEILFEAESGDVIPVFTTRADTLFGVSYIVLAPEHPLVKTLTKKENAAEVEAYQLAASKQDDIERLSTSKPKTGVPTGSFCINPANGDRIPVFIADYVLAGYGSGAVMGVPAHDSRDVEFAKKYNLKVRRVVDNPVGPNTDAELPFCDYGIMTDSAPEFDGLTSQKGKTAVVKWLEKKGKANFRTNYRLRDWSVSRQRFWGCPIPIVVCDKCGDVPVPETELPVKLPYDVNFTPDGKSPLGKHAGFTNVTCPVCGRPARRDPDTLDTFVCSSWYFLRYPDANNSAAAFDTAFIDKMLPVDKYVGGAEHACMHLLYARFFTKALRDAGLLHFDEPFTSLVHQGLILGPDGFKMSKSRGNVINPDKYVTEFGADVFRLYLMFGFNFIEGGPWNDDGIKAMSRFVDRIERLVKKAAEIKPCKGALPTPDKDAKEMEFCIHSSLKSINTDLAVFGFNTAIARIMETVNAISKYDALPSCSPAVLRGTIEQLVKTIAPLAPHLAEEYWETLGYGKSVFAERYPAADESKLVKDEIEYAIQVNAKVRARITLATSLTEDEIKAAALAHSDILPFIKDAQVKKVIVIPRRNVNIVL